MDHVKAQKEGTKIALYAPIKPYDKDRLVSRELALLMQKGYTRISLKGEIIYIEEYLESKSKDLKKKIGTFADNIEILVDRFVSNDEEDNLKRIADSINTAFYEGGGSCILDIIDKERVGFNNRFELDGITFLEPSPQLFNYNNPYGACKKCEGYGMILGIDPKKVIPNHSLSLYEGAVACWKGESHGRWLDQVIYTAEETGIPIHEPYRSLSTDHKDILWEGCEQFSGIQDFFEALQSKSYKIQNRILMARYRGRTVCSTCKGGRLRDEASYVFVDQKTISELIHLPISDLKEYIDHIKLTKYQEQISSRILVEIKTRLDVMYDIGLSYLTLDRAASTLSGGETQRINLTRTLGSNLTSSMYILDEPSIGLHPKDTDKLVAVLKSLRDMGNTVIVVEHEEEVITNADYLVDVGPRAGVFGGNIVYSGAYKDIKKKAKDSLTAQYISGTKSIPVPKRRRQPTNKILVTGATQHNLKNIDVTIPLQCMTAITGVSGSGKTSLVKHILYPALLKELNISHPSNLGKYDTIDGDLKMIKGVEFINQNPIGRSSRSNPITYIKAYDEIRKLMVKQQLSKIRGYKPKHFSFNTEGGRCENCQGDGHNTVEMQFLADVKLLCEDCKGKRFKPEILEVNYKGSNIYDILNMSVSESLEFFSGVPRITDKIQPLEDVGLGYVKLGQASSTLSGGEAQRVKLASFLGKDKGATGQFFIFDEPTTGLHFDDIRKLLDAFNALIEQGNTVCIVEHNMEVIKSADWVVDLGPVGGEDGGHLVFQGTPEDLAKRKKSFTGQYLKDKL